jgi:hypothetical protein
MRDGLVLVLIGLIGIGGFFLWQTYSESRAPQPVNVSVESVVPPPPPKAPAPREKPKPIVVNETPVVAVVAPAPEPPPQPAVVPLPPPPFPAVEEISSGAPAEVVTTKFGDPSLSLLTSTRGRMVGTYVYARDKGRQATVIQLEDGKVASAYSKNAPAQAAGLSVPRQKRTE